MTALSTLLDAVRSGSTLAWLLVHAPHGDADRAVREAWRDAGVAPAELIDLCGCLGQQAEDTADSAWRGTTMCERSWACPEDFACPTCCNAIRAAVPCPSWAELTEGR